MLVSFSAVFRDVMQHSPERNSCSYWNHIAFPGLSQSQLHFHFLELYHETPPIIPRVSSTFSSTERHVCRSVVCIFQSNCLDHECKNKWRTERMKGCNIITLFNIFIDFKIKSSCTRNLSTLMGSDYCQIAAKVCNGLARV